MNLRKLRHGYTIYMVNPDWGIVYQCFVEGRVKYEEIQVEGLWSPVLDVTQSVVYDAHKPLDNQPEYDRMSIVFDPGEENRGRMITTTLNKAIRWAQDGLKSALAKGYLVVTESGNLAKVRAPEQGIIHHEEDEPPGEVPIIMGGFMDGEGGNV